MVEPGYSFGHRQAEFGGISPDCIAKLGTITQQRLQGVMRKLDFKLKTATQCSLPGRDGAMTRKFENAFDIPVQNR
jgi:hypothetical protein